MLCPWFADNVQNRQPMWGLDCSGWGEGSGVYLFVQFVFNLNNLYNPPSLQIVSDSLFVKASPYYLA